MNDKKNNAASCITAIAVKNFYRSYRYIVPIVELVFVDKHEYYECPRGGL